MALTALDPNTALIIVDVQKGIFGLPAIDSMTDNRPEDSAYSLGQVFPRLGESGSSHDIITRLQTRAAQDCNGHDRLNAHKPSEILT